jgi:hypothetical protein
MLSMSFFSEWKRYLLKILANTCGRGICQCWELLPCTILWADTWGTDFKLLPGCRHMFLWARMQGPNYIWDTKALSEGPGGVEWTEVGLIPPSPASCFPFMRGKKPDGFCLLNKCCLSGESPECLRLSFSPVPRVFPSLSNYNCSQAFAQATPTPQPPKAWAAALSGALQSGCGWFPA